MLTTRFRSQQVAWPFFAVAAVLFLLQVLFGLLIAAQYVWPNLLIDVLPFNVGRATHLNLMVLWALLGLMGATYYLVCDETDSELFSVKLAWVQLGVLVVAALGNLAATWFFHASRGKPFTEAPMPWPWLIALGAVLFLVNVGATIVRGPRRTAVTVVLFGGMTGLSLLYLINLFTFDNLSVDFFWWWWLIHLWVEGTWELVAASITAWLLIRLTGVERDRVQFWLYVEVALTLFTGIIGIGHHYYWIGTPSYWLFWGALFSAFEPVPIALMMIEALRSMRRRSAAPAGRTAFAWLGASVIAHFFGAAVWGFAITLPQVNRWTHGTQATAAHGHFAFFGAFAMLVFAAVYTIVPALRAAAQPAGYVPARGPVAFGERPRGLWAFALMTAGMLIMVAAFTGAGVIQVYLHRVVGLDFMTVRTTYLTPWLFGVLSAGLVLFLPGAAAFAWDLFGRTAGAPGPTVRAT